MDPCIQCTKRSVIERSVLVCGASNLFFDYPLGAVEFSPGNAASERAGSSIYDVKRLRRDHFEHSRRQEASKRAFSTSRGFGAIIFEYFSTSGGFAANSFELSRRLEASERAFSSIFDVWRLRSDDFSSDFGVWRVRSKDFQ